MSDATKATIAFRFLGDNEHVILTVLVLEIILPVVSPEEHDRLVGVLTRRDIISAYNQAVLKKSLLNPRRARSN
ncbi:MAG: CBS domain-containing protein [Desulfobacterales bacterium]|nr:CBS domain-containing protein [Desulfobacterales bacterium]